ncbi:MAG: conjugal transfer protein TraI [Mariniphaga sp.]|nr:conjugal transfer protein TraI [Mariniphaga sp.]
MKLYIKIMAIVLCCSLTVMPSSQSNATPVAILEIIKAGIVKVIKAVDLQIQRLQNKTIWLQNAQKTIENALSKLKLNEISDWTERQKTLYKDYFEELAKVKSIITYYQRIREISKKQVRLVEEYQRAWNLLQQDKYFTADELAYMAKVYSGILNESAKNLDQIFLVINSFTTQMSDAKRLEIINAAADEVDANYFDLTRFNKQNIMLSLQRARENNDVEVVKKLYGLPTN